MVSIARCFGKARTVALPKKGLSVVLYKDQFTFEQDVTDGWCVLVPAGTWHDVTNTGDGPMRLYAIYAPVHHAAGKVQPTAVDAERDEKAGTDEPPTRSVQPTATAPDEHAT